MEIDTKIVRKDKLNPTMGSFIDLEYGNIADKKTIISENLLPQKLTKNTNTRKKQCEKKI